MANSVTALNPDQWKSDVQDFLNAQLVLGNVANMRFEAELMAGDTLDWPTVTDVRVQSYSSGTDVTVDDIAAASSSMSIDQSRVVGYYIDPTEVRQAKAKNYVAKLTRQAAHVIAQEMDQNGLKTGIDAANTTRAGGTLSNTTMLSTMTSTMSDLHRANAADGEMFFVLDPERTALLAQEEASKGFSVADATLRGGYIGDSASGFKTYTSNNLPTAVTLTMDTQPTATDTFTIHGVTFTFVADGTAASAGEVNVGADVADAKTIVVAAINGTSSADYVDVSTADRRKLQNAQVSAAAFSGNDCAITAFGKIGASETFTAGTNVFGTETGSLVAGRRGAISIGMQMQPNLYIKPEPKQLGDNYLTHTLYGKKVFSRDADRLVNVTINV